MSISKSSTWSLSKVSTSVLRAKRAGRTSIAGRGKQGLKSRAKKRSPERKVRKRLRAKQGSKNGFSWTLINADAVNGVQSLSDNSVDCVVTSPPYYWQRDYGVSGQIGQEDTLEAYIQALTKIFTEVHRVLKKTGTMFLVLGDTYYSGKGQPQGWDPKHKARAISRIKYRAVDRPGFGLPKKSLIGVPWRV